MEYISDISKMRILLKYLSFRKNFSFSGSNLFVNSLHLLDCEAIELVFSLQVVLPVIKKRQPDRFGSARCTATVDYFVNGICDIPTKLRMDIYCIFHVSLLYYRYINRFRLRTLQACHLIAAFSFFISNFFILSSAPITSFPLGPLSMLSKAAGTTCQDTPYLSLSQPHWLSFPPWVSFFQ